MLKSEMQNGSIHYSNSYGKYTVINYINPDSIEIEFCDTGYKTFVRAASIRLGSIKDKIKPSICGVGFIGDGSYVAKEKGRHTPQYKKWLGMIRRCYSPVELKRRPTYIDCTVCDEWHNFQNFAKWFDENNIPGCHLDKDIKINENKIYSPASCSFVSCRDNTEKALAKHYVFTSPEGDKVEVYNLNKFSFEKGLDASSMLKVFKGKAKSHKGWTFWAGKN